MVSAGYTTIYNYALRDPSLSLPAKGLYAIIKSFIGLPGFLLTKHRLAAACSDSDYLLNAAWKELKNKGYLQHYYSTAENGAFCHTYNLMQKPAEPAAYVYSPVQTRPNGDCVCISTEQRDYTNLSTAVLRDKNISLASKGLFALVSHLLKIPAFVLRPEGVRSFCKEKLKHFSTLWKKFKISGLLKQHRFPSGNSNRWTYDYELCPQPDLETPYLTNHHTDGSVSTVATIDAYLEKFKRGAASVKQRFIPSVNKPRPKCPNKQPQKMPFDPKPLRRKYGKKLTDALTAAVRNICYADRLTVQGAQVPSESRETVARSISQETIEHFLDGLSVDTGHIKNPVGYFQTALYTYHQKLLTPDRPPVETEPSAYDTPDDQRRQLNAWEQDWLDRIHAFRRQQTEQETE